MTLINKALCQELIEMEARDQEVRKTYIANRKESAPLDQSIVEQMLLVDKANLARMKEIIAQYGWPGKSLVGEDGARAAWLLVQHATQDLHFQKQCLELLETAVAANEALPAQLAYLTDRVRVFEGKPQVYGTQYRIVNGECVPNEIEDKARVDERRAKVGLAPLADYLTKSKQLHVSN